MELPLGSIVWEAPFHSFPFYTVTSHPHSHWNRQRKNVIQKAIQESLLLVALSKIRKSQSML